MKLKGRAFCPKCNTLDSEGDYNMCKICNTRVKLIHEEVNNEKEPRPQRTS